MKYSCFFLSLLSLNIIGCASTPPRVPAPDIVNDKKYEKKYVPALNEKNTAEVGENLYSEYVLSASQTHSVTLNADAIAEMDLGNKINIPTGTRGLLSKTFRTRYNAVCFDRMAKSLTTGRNDICLIDKDGNGVFSQTMFKTRLRYFNLNQPVPYTVVSNDPVYSATQNGFKRVALYQGVSKGSVKVSFREFSDGLARPAFTQDVSYDLEQDGTTIIAFKGLRIKVLKASSSNIEYKVLEPFHD